MNKPSAYAMVAVLGASNAVIVVDEVKSGAACDIVAAYVVSGPSDELVRIVEQTGARLRR